ncbi:MAG: leucine-rich repeat domain-containing protein [Clostridiales bacterium]|nr:leucine-rich repeat domain-containing protein [Clostridiales bacterium]
MFKGLSKKERIYRFWVVGLITVLFASLTFMSVKTLIAYFESKKIKDYDVHFANLEIALYNANNEEFTSIKGSSVPINGILPGDTIPINIGKVVNKSNTSVYALANLVVTIEPITPRTETLVLSTWYNLNGDKIKVSNFEKNEIPATKLKASAVDSDGFTINYTLPGNKVTNAYKMGKVSASFGVYGIQSFLPEIENQARDPELKVCEIIVSRLANQEFEEEAVVTVEMETETEGLKIITPGDESYNQEIKNINRNSCGLYLDENMTIPLEENIYDLPEGTKLYTKKATLDKLQIEATGGICSIMGSDQVTGEVVIPKTYYDEESGEEIPVTRIESEAFDETYLESLITPDGLLEIGADALKNCPNVTYVKIPDTLTTLGSGAFFGCTKLESIDLSGTTLTSVASSAFYQCSSIKEVKLPETVTTIGNHTFAFCSSLEYLDFPDGLTGLGSSALNNCTSLKELILPEGFSYIGEYGIANCTSLEKIVIPSTLTNLNNTNEFDKCSAKLQVLEVAENNPNLKNVNGFLIYKTTRCVLGTNSAVTVPDGVTHFGRYCVWGQENRTEIDLPDGLTIIEYNAFQNCSSIDGVLLPTTCKTIYHQAFMNCTSLSKIVIPEGTTKIDLQVFSGCSNLSEVILPSTLTTIGQSSFSGIGTKSPATIILPENLTTLGVSAFRGAKIENITINSKLETIQSEAFSGKPISNVFIDATATEVDGEIVYESLFFTNLRANSAYADFYHALDNTYVIGQPKYFYGVVYVEKALDDQSGTGILFDGRNQWGTNLEYYRVEGETKEYNGKIYNIYKSQYQD